MTPEQATKFELEHPDCVIVDSEEISGLSFIVKSTKKDGGIIINAGKYGSIAIRSSLLKRFVNELDEIVNLYDVYDKK